MAYIGMGSSNNNCFIMVCFYEHKFFRVIVLENF